MSIKISGTDVFERSNSVTTIKNITTASNIKTIMDGNFYTAGTTVQLFNRDYNIPTTVYGINLQYTYMDPRELRCLRFISPGQIRITLLCNTTNPGLMKFKYKLNDEDNFYQSNNTLGVVWDVNVITGNVLTVQLQTHNNNNPSYWTSTSVNVKVSVAGNNIPLYIDETI